MKKYVKEYLEKVARTGSQKEKEEFMQIIMGGLFCMVTEPEILQKIPQLPQKDRVMIASQAESLMEIPLLKTILQDMRAVACAKMYKESKNWEEMLGGKFMLYTIEVLEKKIEHLSKIKL